MAEWIAVAAVDDLPPGQMLAVEVDGEWIGLYNVDGTVHATQACCTHAEAFLTEGRLEGEEVECPLHGARFNVRTGAALSLPAIAPLATYPVKMEGGWVHVKWE